MELTLILLVVSLFGCSSQALKILFIYPAPLYSHQVPAIHLAEGLVEKGHEVFFVSPNTMPGLKRNYTFVDVSLSTGSDPDQEKDKIVDLERQISKWNIIKAFAPAVSIPGRQFQTEAFSQFRKKVQTENITFDAAIVESGSLPYSSAMIQLLSGNVPIIAMFTISIDSLAEESLGSIQHFSYIPSTFESYTSKMNIWQKIDNWLINHYLIWQLKDFMEGAARSFFRENYGREYESLVDGCWTKISLSMLPTNFMYYYPRLLGPIHIKPPQKLPKVLQGWLDGAEKGVIYFNLGSNMKSISLPEVARSNFLTFFKQLPPGYRVLWKWERDGTIPGQSNNILAQKWIPQQSVLAHPKVKVFITQGGLQSFQEAVHYGVPTLGIPWFGDKNTNVAKMVDAEIGVQLLPSELVSYEKVEGAINAVLFHEKYLRNMKKHSALSRDFTSQALDKAIFWVEHVARHGGAHLRPSTADTTYFQFFCLDIISVILVLSLSALYLLFLILKYLLSFAFQKWNRKIKEA